MQSNASILAIFIVQRTLSDEVLCSTKIILIFEWLALASFGVSWMIKGGFMFKDKPMIS